MIRKTLTKDIDTEISLTIGDNSRLFKFVVSDFGDRFSFALTPEEVDSLLKNLTEVRDELKGSGTID